jgi:chlorobactene glucosyltransferase
MTAMTTDFLNGIILLSLSAMGAVTIVNIVGFASLSRRRSPQGARISVLIPARNEERNIGRVLDLLASQDYPDYEVIVLDDQSEDLTASVVRQHMETQPRISLLTGKPLPPGWVGKAHACAQLASAARGDVLLFLDADTRPSTRALSAGLADLERTGADLLTVIPRQQVVSFWERVLLPLLHFNTFSFLPMPLVPLTRTPSLAMANGQYMLFRRRAYDAVGGHASVRSALVEDVWLARRIKASGRKLVIRYGGETVSCRMYGSFREIWEGFSKNVFPGLNYSVTMLAAVVILTLISSILPFLLLGGALAGWGGLTYWTPLAEVGIILAIRLGQALRFDMDLWPVLLHPVAMLIFLAIAVNSFLWTLKGEGIRWKGRAYNLSNPPVIP